MSSGISSVLHPYSTVANKCCWGICWLYLLSSLHEAGAKHMSRNNCTLRLWVIIVLKYSSRPDFGAENRAEPFPCLCCSTAGRAGAGRRVAVLTSGCLKVTASCQAAETSGQCRGLSVWDAGGFVGIQQMIHWHVCIAAGGTGCGKNSSTCSFV